MNNCFVDIHKCCLIDAERIEQRNHLSERGMNPILNWKLFGILMWKQNPGGVKERREIGVGESGTIHRLSTHYRLFSSPYDILTKNDDI